MLILVAFFVCAAVLGWYIGGELVGIHTSSSRVLVTSGKITELGGYEKVWSDEGGDYSVYVKTNYVAAQLKKGVRVTINGQAAGVVSSTPTYFYVSVDEDKGPYIPGTVVKSVNDDVGFVSGIDENLNIKCYYY